MAEIRVYSFEDHEGEESLWTTTLWNEAQAYARKYGLRVIENLYEWTGSQPLPEGDFTRKGASR
jgi:hypothetical protein